MTQKFYRFDVAELNGPRLDSRGFLHADAVFSKAGVFEYQLPDGTKRRELRPEQEVTKKDSVESIKSAPITFEHPPVPLTSENATHYVIGHVKEDAKSSGKKIQGGIMVHNKQAIQDCMDGKMRDVSGGYHCALKMDAGTHPEFGEYDAVQSDIVYNHLAMTKQGRQGKDVGIKMDSIDKDTEVAFMVFNADSAAAEKEEDEAIAKLQAIQKKEKEEKKKDDDDEEGDMEGDAKSIIVEAKNEKKMV